MRAGWRQFQPNGKLRWMRNDRTMSKRMSKTLAAEIAERVLKVVNPANRALALSEALRRHGFGASMLPEGGVPGEKAALVAWLIEAYRGE